VGSHIIYKVYAKIHKNIKVYVYVKILLVAMYFIYKQCISICNQIRNDSLSKVLQTMWSY